MVALTATRHWLSKIHQIVAGATVFPAIWAPNTVVAPFELTNYPVSASLWRFSFSTYSTGPTTPSGPNKRRSCECCEWSCAVHCDYYSLRDKLYETLRCGWMTWKIEKCVPNDPLLLVYHASLHTSYEWVSSPATTTTIFLHHVYLHYILWNKLRPICGFCKWSSLGIF